jgi:hypothetical protein
MDRRMTYELHMGFHGMTTRVTDSDDIGMRFSMVFTARSQSAPRTARHTPCP